MTIADTVYEKLKAAPPEIAREVLDFLEFLEAKAVRTTAKPRQSFEDFYGNLKVSQTFAGDPVDIQRKLRDEWER